MTESQDVSLLQRRARRRVVGAIALVVLVVIALPIVLDREPSPIGQDLVIQIPSQEAGKFSPRMPPPSPAGAPANGTVPVPASPPVQAPAESKAPAAPTVKKDIPPAAKESAAPAAKEPAAPPAKGSIAPATKEPAAKNDTDAARAKALLEGKDVWVVKLGAFSKLENVRHLRSKMKAAGVKSYTETVKGPNGEQTRVRAGPFDTRQEAEQAQKKLTAAGISPGTVGTR